MANSAPMIGEAGLDFAVDVMNAGYRTGHYVKLCYIGCSLAGVSADALYGGLLRLLNVPEFDGFEVTSDNMAGLIYTAVAQDYNTSKLKPEPGGTSIVPGLPTNLKQVYTPHQTIEWVFADAVIPAPANLGSNALVLNTISNSPVTTESLFRPAFARQFHKGDWISGQMDGGGDITYRVYFLANSDGVDQNKIFLQAYKLGDTGVNLGATAPEDYFGTYAATPTIFSKTLTVPAAGAASAPDISFCVRVAGDGELNLNGKNVVICGAEVCRDRATGLGWLWIRLGGASSSTYIDAAKFGPNTWDRLAEAGTTHVMICLDANSATLGIGVSTHKTNLATLISNIRAKVPNCKFCLVSPYDLSPAAFDDYVEASYAVARAGGHLFLNVANYLPPFDALTAGFQNRWTASIKYYAGDVLQYGAPPLSADPYFACNETHWATADWADNAAKFTQLISPDLNYILENTLDQRNLMIMGDGLPGVHPNRARGGVMYAGVIVALLHRAAEMARMQLGEHGVFRKL